MAPKGKGKGGAKQMVALAQLTALQSTYKAASRRHGVTPRKDLLTLIEEAIQDQSSINKVSLTGPDVTFGELAALLDCMAGYNAVKNLCMWSCNVGDKGLIALGTLLKASASDRWWRGSKLKHVELCSDGIGLDPTRWGERYMAHVNGELPTLGTGMQLPSLALGQTQAITPDTLKMQDLELPAPWAPPGHGEPGGPDSTLAALAAQHPLGDDDDEEDDDDGGGGGGGGGGGDDDEQDEDGDDEGGGDDGGGGSSGGAATTAGATGTNGSTAVPQEGTQADSSGNVDADGIGLTTDPGGGTLRSTLHGTVSSATRAASRLTLHQDADMDGRFSTLFAGSVPITSATYEQHGMAHTLRDEHRHAERSARGLPPLAGAPTAAVEGRGALPAAPPPPGTGDCTEASISGSGGGGATGNGYASAPSFRQPRPMAFSPPALKAFSLGLSVVGLGLQVLALDHNELGNAGARILAEGLKRCTKLQHLSLEDCGIGPVGAAALAATMTPNLDRKGVGMQPAYAALNLSRNPLGGSGLSELCHGLEHCTNLMVLNLAATELTEGDVPALKSLASVLAKRTNIDQVDLDANFFGDGGAAVFIPFLTEAKHMRKFRITARGMSRAVGGAIGQILKEHRPKKKGAGKKKKK